MKWRWYVAGHSYTLHVTDRYLRIPMDVIPECGRKTYLNPDRHVPRAARYCPGCVAAIGGVAPKPPKPQRAPEVLTGAACSSGAFAPGLWDVEGSTGASRALAAHVCRQHCPVAAKCLREARRMPQPGYIMAGLEWPGPRKIAPVHRCDLCPPLATS